MVISSMISALLFGVACWYPEKVWAVGEAGKGSTPYMLPLQQGTEIEQTRGDARAVESDESSQRLVNRSDTRNADQRSSETPLTVVAQPVSDELKDMIDTLPLTERRLFLTLLDDPITAALLMMAARHPRFVDTIRHFRLMPEDVQQAYWASQHTMRGAVSNTPSSYRALGTVADVEGMPLSMPMAESVARVLYDSNTLYLSYLFLNLLIWTGSGLASAAHGTIVPWLWHRGAVATVQDPNIAATCDLVMAGRTNPQITGTLEGSLQLSSDAVLGSACVGFGIAVLPAVAHNVFMPLVMAGVLGAMKLYYGLMERRRDRALYRTALERTDTTIRLLEQRLGDLDIEQLMLSAETQALLTEIAQNPGQLLPIAVGISRLPARDFEEVSAAVIAITRSLHIQNEEEITEEKWQTTLKKLLQIEPYQGGQPRTSGVINSLYHMFSDRSYVRIYAPLLLGFMLAAALHTGAGISLGIMAPHIAILGRESATVIPEANITTLCNNMNFTGSFPAAMNVTGILKSPISTGLGTILNTFASSFLLVAMGNIYSPIQRLLTNPTVRGWAARLASICGRTGEGADEREKVALLEYHKRHPRTRSLRQTDSRASTSMENAGMEDDGVSYGSEDEKGAHGLEEEEGAHGLEEEEGAQGSEDKEGGAHGVKEEKGVQHSEGDDAAQGLEEEEGVQRLMDDAAAQVLEEEEGVQRSEGDDVAQGLEEEKGVQRSMDDAAAQVLEEEEGVQRSEGDDVAQDSKEEGLYCSEGDEAAQGLEEEKGVQRSEDDEAAQGLEEEKGVQRSEGDDVAQDSEEEEGLYRSEDDDAAHGLEEEKGVQRSEGDDAAQDSEEEEGLYRSEDDNAAPGLEEEKGVQRSEGDDAAQDSEEEEGLYRSEDDDAAQGLEEEKGVQRSEGDDAAQDSEEEEGLYRSEDDDAAQGLEEEKGVQRSGGDDAAQDSEEEEGLYHSEDEAVDHGSEGNAAASDSATTRKPRYPWVLRQR